jgi:PII-like signaling protein
LFGIADDRPITIVVVETEDVIRRVTPEIRPLVRDGVMLLVDVEMVQ